MDKYRKIDKKINKGYELLRRKESLEGCSVLLDAWEDIKTVMAEDNIKDLAELEKKYPWTEFIMNYVQDIEEELHNAGLKDPQYFSKRIQYCKELLEICDDDELIIENTRRGLAESHFALGNKQKCDQLFKEWLSNDPAWGWGYIGWSDCYQYDSGNTATDYLKAEEIISMGLNEKNLKDRADVVDRAIEISVKLGKNQEAKELEKELMELTRAPQSKAAANIPHTVNKIGRNEPCPCGSGKKYKKCCGK